MKDDFVKPIVVLTLICLLVAGALAVTNAATEPVIKAAAAERADQARREAIPGASGFTEVSTEGLPDTVREVYASDNGVGYVFTVVVKGYGGDITVICSIDNDGKIMSTAVLPPHSETSGIGTRIEEPQFTDTFIGAGPGLEGVSAVTGATISTTAYIQAIKDAFAAYELIKG